MARTEWVTRSRSLAVLLLAGASLAACATPHPRLASRFPAATAPSGAGGRYKVGDPYQVAGVWYVPKEQPNYDETGMASWYGDQFNLKPTANGEIFDMTALSAAHTTLPLPCIVEVTNLDNGRKLQVRVNDRGPFVGGRLIDLSHAAARELGYDRAGLAHVRVRYVGPATLGGPDAGLRYASNQVKPPAINAPPLRATLPTPALPTPALPTPAWPSATLAPLTGAALPALPMASVAVASAALPPIPGVAMAPPPVAAPLLQPAPIRMAAAAPPVQVAPSAPAPISASVYRVQAGAFSDQANAQRAASQLGAAGDAVIETVQRNGATLYRVVLQSTTDEGEAWALRDRVAAYGFGDARVLRPF
ncbi:septal ring lytic transglycosylase RlpA family protein [Phenylobacterium aquaticum]|uniref:septal ring lytic transglycosylase RlpA family protein n=1 Tax=Phenylobacterium aquaticum TaxID=1763816 RepID=UPI0026EEC636|nr:septal ring lytic transglycosylase RlpA family protein [Phenylobacterium aquaticum]